MQIGSVSRGCDNFHVTHRYGNVSMPEGLLAAKYFFNQVPIGNIIRGRGQSKHDKQRPMTYRKLKHIPYSFVQFSSLHTHKEQR